MSEYQPITITTEMVDPNVTYEPSVHSESRVAEDRSEMRASAEKARVLANNAEFQQRVPTAAWHNLTSQEEGQRSRETTDAWLKARVEFLEWLTDFPPAEGMSESERAMAYMAVLNATGG